RPRPDRDDRHARRDEGTPPRAVDRARRRGPPRARRRAPPAPARAGRPRRRRAPGGLRRPDRPFDHRPDLDAADRAPRPRPEPGGGLRGAPPFDRRGRGRRGGSRMTAPSLATPVARTGIANRFAREVNATFAIAWR